MKTIAVTELIQQLPDVIHESPDVMPHDDMLEVIQHLTKCNKQQAVDIAVIAFTSRCTVMQASERFFSWSKR